MDRFSTSCVKHDDAETYAELTDSTDMFTLARRIDNSLNSMITDLLNDVTFWNGILKGFGGREVFVPVGSSQDGSKVNVPGDGGDVDILLISKAFVLEEKLLEYDSLYPAFLRVRGDGNHSKLFQMKRLVDDVYVPVNVLKHLERRMYGLMRFLVSAAFRPGLSGYEEQCNAIRETAVGMEMAALDGLSSIDALHTTEVPDGSFNKVSLLLKFFNNALESVNAMTDSGDPHEFCNAQSTFSDAAEGVASAGIKVEKFFRDLNVDSDLKESNEIKPQEPQTTPLYRSNIIDEKEALELPKLMSADIVPAFIIQGWPRVAEEWITRQRLWPQKEIVMNTVQTGCQIVAKRPLYPELNGDRNNEDHSPEADDHDVCFRLSFSQCELALAKQLSEVPLLCWKTLKAYQKAFLRTDPPVLTSYHWKTVLFWIREQTDDEFWSEGNLMNCVRMALDFMITCLKDRFLPGYFTRGENLITGCRDDLVVASLNIITDIRKAPFKYLSMFLEDPPTPDVYKISKEKIQDFLSRKCQQNMAEDMCDSLIHAAWTSIAQDKTQDEEDGYDRFEREFPDNFRNIMQLMKQDDTDVPSSQNFILTGFESLMESLFKLVKKEQVAESDNGKEQIIYSREQKEQSTTQPEPPILDMPSKAIIKNDQAGLTNESTTAEVNGQEEMGEDQGLSAAASKKSSQKCGDSVDPKVKAGNNHKEYHQTEKNVCDKTNNAEASNNSNNQSADSLSQRVNTFVEFLNDFVQIASEDDDSGNAFRSFARHFARHCLKPNSGEKGNNHDKKDDSCKTSKSTIVPCAEAYEHDSKEVAEDHGSSNEASNNSCSNKDDSLSPNVKTDVDYNDHQQNKKMLQTKHQMQKVQMIRLNNRPIHLVNYLSTVTKCSTNSLGSYLTKNIKKVMKEKASPQQVSSALLEMF